MILVSYVCGKVVEGFKPSSKNSETVLEDGSGKLLNIATIPCATVFEKNTVFGTGNLSSSRYIELKFKDTASLSKYGGLSLLMDATVENIAGGLAIENALKNNDIRMTDITFYAEEQENHHPVLKYVTIKLTSRIENNVEEFDRIVAMSTFKVDETMINGLSNSGWKSFFDTAIKEYEFQDVLANKYYMHFTKAEVNEVKENIKAIPDSQSEMLIMSLTMLRDRLVSTKEIMGDLGRVGGGKFTSTSKSPTLELASDYGAMSVHKEIMEKNIATLGTDITEYLYNVIDEIGQHAVCGKSIQFMDGNSLASQKELEAAINLLGAILK